jgi:hypothetical protein
MIPENRASELMKRTDTTVATTTLPSMNSAATTSSTLKTMSHPVRRRSTIRSVIDPTSDWAPRRT